MIDIESRALFREQRLRDTERASSSETLFLLILLEAALMWFLKACNEKNESWSASLETTLYHQVTAIPGKHWINYDALLLRRWYEIIALNYIKSILTDFSASRQDKRQNWNLSKILHRWIFRLKILHRQFHLI